MRPACTPCLRSKKTCPGYPAPPRSARPHEVISIAPKPILASNQAAPVAIRQAPIAKDSGRRDHKQRQRETALQQVVPLQQQQQQRQNLTPPQTPGPSIVSYLSMYRPAGDLNFERQDGMYFQLFQAQTAGELSGYFDSVFWTQTVLQECHSEGAIRHAVVALGALYKTLEQSTESPPGSPSDTYQLDSVYQHWEVAVKQYSEALSALVRLHRDQKSHRTRLMATVLLACFDSFIGDHKQAIIQIQAGLRLLDQLRAERRTSFNLTSEEPVEEELITMFKRLAIQAKSYDMAFHFPHPYVIELTPQQPEQAQSPSSEAGSSPSSLSPPMMPDQFYSLREARLAWDTLLEKMLRFTETLFTYTRASGGNNPMGILPKSIQAYGLSFRGQLKQWAEAFEPILQSRTAPGVTHQEKAGIAVLKMFQIMSQILYLMTFSDSELHFDAFHNEFKTIVDLALEVVGDEERRAAAKRCPDPEYCTHRHHRTPDIFGGFDYNTHHIKPSFSADLGIVPPLFVAATKCRNPIIRRQAIQLLKSSARREGMWDSELTARIGQWVVDIEEDEFVTGPLKPWSPPVNGSSNGSAKKSPSFGDNTPLGPGGNARWDGREGGRKSSIAGPPKMVPEEKRVMVRAVDFDLRTRFARLQVGTRNIIPGAPDMRSRVTQFSW